MERFVSGCAVVHLQHGQGRVARDGSKQPRCVRQLGYLRHELIDKSRRSRRSAALDLCAEPLRDDEDVERGG